MPRAAVRLGPNFPSSDFPGWGVADDLQAAHAQQLVDTLLQPTRNVFGRILVTSWLRREGVHATGAAADIVPLDAPVPVVHRWMAQQLHGGFGELIDEVPTTGTTGHIHVTLPGFGGDGEVLYEPENQVYWAGLRPFPDGTVALPFVLAVGLGLALLKRRR